MGLPAEQPIRNAASRNAASRNAASGSAAQRDLHPGGGAQITTSENTEDVTGVCTTTSQPLLEKEKPDSETDMETSLSKDEKEANVSQGNSDAWQESKQDVMT